MKPRSFGFVMIVGLSMFGITNLFAIEDLPGPEIELEGPLGTPIANGGSYDFGALMFGFNLDAVFTITNSGVSELTLTTPITIGGADAGEFSIEVQPSSPVAQGGGTTFFTIRFTPTGIGAKTATISIANNDGDENPYDLTITGTGTAPEINVKNGGDIPDGGQYDFGSKLRGTHTDVVLTIENLGAADLTIPDDLNVTGADAGEFSIEQQPGPTTIPVAGSTTFTVRFSPTTDGDKTAAISIDNNDGDENPYDIALKGKGEPVVLTLEKAYRDHMGILNPPAGTHHYSLNEIVDITATPTYGRVFVKWEGDVADPLDRTTTVTMDADKTVRAHFDWREQRLTMAVEPVGAGMTTPPIGKHYYKFLDYVDLKAVPAAGYAFVRWEGRDIVDPTKAETTMRTWINQTVTAHFAMADDQGPYLVNVFPTPNADHVPRNTPVQFKAEDAGEGVDLSTLDAWIDGEAIVTGGVDQTGGQVTITSHSPAYTVLYVPDTPFDADATVTLRARFQDLSAAAHVCDTTCTFDVWSSLYDEADVKIQLVETTGDTVRNEALDVTVYLPDSVFSDKVWMSVGAVDTLPPVPDEWIPFGLKIEIGPDSLVFGDSVTISIPYTQADLDSAGVATPEELPVLCFDVFSDWNRIRVIRVEPAEGLVFVRVGSSCLLTYARAAGPGSAGGLLSTGLEDSDGLPTEFGLAQNYPNPFNPETRIAYDLPRSTHVSLVVYDVTGRMVRSLVDAVIEAGRHEAVWDGRDGLGRQATTGIYLFEMRAGDRVFIRKASLLK